MRVRALDTNGDMTFGQSSANFLIDSPSAVAQAIEVRLQLWTGEWFLDQTVGMPWTTQVLGSRTQTLYDAAIIQKILDTPGVASIQVYSSSLATQTRTLTVTATVSTQYSQNVSVTIPIVNVGV